MPSVAAADLGRSVSPPSFLALAGHPLRWRLLSELARSDRRVRELCAPASASPQSLVSYHLGRLRAEAAGVDAAQLGRRPRRLLPRSISRAAASCSARPARRCTPGCGSARAARRRAPGAACARALPVHGQQRALADGRGAGRAARRRVGRGVQRRQPPQAAAPERRAGHARARASTSPTGAPSTSTSSPAQRFDCVVTLCDRVREVCPELPGRPGAHPLEHPRPGAAATRRATYRAFERTADELAHAHRLPAATASPGGTPEQCTTDLVSVRYMVDDVDAAIAFYTTHLGFSAVA